MQRKFFISFILFFNVQIRVIGAQVSGYFSFFGDV